MTAPSSQRNFRYYDFVMAAFVTVLLCSNLIGAAKAAQVTVPILGPVTFGAGVLFFPISYIFGDILTEVYGYGRDRRVVWAGFAALIFASFMSLVVLALPVAPFMADYQKSLTDVFGNTWRIVMGSLIAFWCGSFANSYTLAKMKLWTNGRWLWMRTVGSTITGQFVDTTIVILIAFIGWTPWSTMFSLIFWGYWFKVIYEAAATPITYLIVNSLKRAESIDVYDRDTNFNPFAHNRSEQRASITTSTL